MVRLTVLFGVDVTMRCDLLLGEMRYPADAFSQWPEPTIIVVRLSLVVDPAGKRAAYLH
jgi:hypothetical protein